MKAIQFALIFLGMVTGAYLGICAGQLVGYYVARWMIGQLTSPPSHKGVTEFQIANTLQISSQLLEDSL